MTAAGGELYSACARHPETAAGFQCCECGQLLCHRCVEIGSHLIFCGLCGERAIELDEIERPQPALAGPGAPSAAARLDEIRAVQSSETSPQTAEPASVTGGSEDSTRRSIVTRPGRPRATPPGAATTRPDRWQTSAPPTSSAGTEVAVFAVNHAVIPATTIAMVSALLFFLLDVRSVYLSGTEALKWIGFCFVTATVLIARYRRTSGRAGREGFYTVALAAATALAMTVSAAKNPATGFPDLLANLVIVALVWRFATRLTRRLSFEGSRSQEPEPRLYGVERLQMEQWQSVHGEGGERHNVGEAPKDDRKSNDDGANPVVPVARLTAAGLLAFALGEPFLLAGPPAAGERALGAMIVFLLAAGVVLATGSGLGNLRRVRSLGGQASLGMLPGRLAAAGATMVLLTALALAIPGLEVRGSGVLRPVAPEDGAPGGDSGQANEEGEGSEQPSQRARQRQGESSGDQRRSTESSAGSTRGAAASLIGHLAELGKWLRVALVAAAVLLALWGLWWCLRNLSRARGWLSATLGPFFRRLLVGLGGLFRWRRKQRRPARPVDPFADNERLRRLDPRQAVIAAYGRLLAAFELLEHPRPERQTPYEFLASIPVQLKRLAGPAKDLTEVYVKAAYSNAAVDDADRRQAIAALEAVRTVSQGMD